MGLLICKYAPFWQEFSVKSLILRWQLRPVGLLFCNIVGLYVIKYKYSDILLKDFVEKPNPNTIIFNFWGI